MGYITTVSSQEVHDSLPLAQKANDITFEQREADIAAEKKAEDEARERARRSPYNNFGQLNLDPDCGKARRALMRTNHSAYEIFDFLVERADPYNAVICSVRVLKEALNLSEATIYRAINALKEHKFIDVKKSGTSNVYHLNGELIWKSYGTNFKHAEFVAKVIIAESEQEKPTKARKMNVVSLKEDSQPRGKDSSLTGKDSQPTEDDVWEDSPSWEREECPEE